MQGEGDGQTADAKGGEDWGQAEIESDPEQDDQAEGHNNQLHEFLRNAGYGFRAGDSARVEAHRIAGKPGGRNGQRGDPKDGERGRNVVQVALRDLRTLGGEMEAEDERPENDGSAQSLRGQFAEMAVGCFGPTAEDAEKNAPQQEPREQGTGEEPDGHQNREWIPQDIEPLRGQIVIVASPLVSMGDVNTSARPRDGKRQLI